MSSRLVRLLSNKWRLYRFRQPLEDGSNGDRCDANIVVAAKNRIYLSRCTYCTIS